jgi:hypothetical protein
MADEILLRFSVKDDGSPVIERVNEKIGKTKKEAEGLVPGLEKAGKGLANFASQNAVLLSTLTAVGALLASSYNDYQKYAGAVRDVALASGTTAEESSRLLQVFDDFQISTEDVTAAMKAMKSNGVVPTIDTLADLADKYQAIQDPAKKLQFVYDNLGRSGTKFLNVLQQSSSALREQAAAVSDSLVLTDEEIRKAEQARLAVDAYSDAIQGAKIAIGSWVGSMIVANDNHAKAIEILKAEGVAVGRGVENTQAYRDAMQQLENAELGAVRSAELHGAALDGDVQSMTDAATAARDLSLSNEDLINNAIEQTKANQDYQKSQADILSQIDELKAKKGDLYSWETDKRKEIDEQITELQDKYAEDADAFEAASNRKLAMMTIEKIAMSDGEKGFTDAEAARALAVAESSGVIEASAIREAVAFDQISTAVANATIRAQDLDKALTIMKKGYTIDVVIQTLNNYAQGALAANGQSGYSQLAAPKSKGYADGGISMGPASGHTELLHGTEAVIPLKSGSIPVQLQGGGNGGGFDIESFMASFMPALADALARSNRSIFEKVGR